MVSGAWRGESRFASPSAPRTRYLYSRECVWWRTGHWSQCRSLTTHSLRNVRDANFLNKTKNGSWAGRFLFFLFFLFTPDWRISLKMYSGQSVSKRKKKKEHWLPATQMNEWTSWAFIWGQQPVACGSEAAEVVPHRCRSALIWRVEPRPVGKQPRSGALCAVAVTPPNPGTYSASRSLCLLPRRWPPTISLFFSLCVSWRASYSWQCGQRLISSWAATARSMRNDFRRFNRCAHTHMGRQWKNK